VPFEIFSRYGNRINRPPTVAIAKQGRIQLNKAATEFFGPDLEAINWVLLMWDKSAKKVGIRPLRKKDKRGYRINFNPNGGAALSSKSFMDFIGYDREQTRWFPARWNEDEQVLEVELVEVDSLPAKQIAKKILEYRRHRTGIVK
jgi:hypothetical protein